MLAWFHLAGRVVHLHRSELGLDESKVESERAPEPFSRDPEALWNEVSRRGGSEAMHADLARHLDGSGDRERRLQHARQHISALLLAFEKPEAALQRTSRMLQIDRGFTLNDTDTMFALVWAASRHNPRELCAHLADNYLARFPNSVKCNEVRLLACEALAEEPSGRRAMAEHWFRQLMTADLADLQRERLAALAKRYL
ncbi:MAG: hypothetical protein LC637_08280 [Xanthomonadaceae bacterium]|nr:hypothetical protein [Xanthomonadaceae bacterium]